MQKSKMIIRAILIGGLLLLCTFVEAKVTEPTASAGYVKALKTANVFLSAWSNRDADMGLKLISGHLSARLKKENNDIWFGQYMSGLSNPRHISFEIGKGKIVNSKRTSFPVVLYEYYTGEKTAFQYKSAIEIIKEDDSWLVDLLPTTSDTK
jgi:hypothetical protein